MVYRGHQCKMLPDRSQRPLRPIHSRAHDYHPSADRITTEKPYLHSHPPPAIRSFRLHYLRTPYVMPPVEQLAVTLSKLMCLVSPREFRLGGWLVIRRDVSRRNRMERHKTRGWIKRGKYIFDCSWTADRARFTFHRLCLHAFRNDTPPSLCLHE